MLGLYNPNWSKC